MNVKPLKTSYTKNLLLPPKGKKYFLFASREGSFVREEPFLSWYIFNNTNSVINIPDGRIWHYYLEKQSAMRALHKLERYIFKNWNKHLGGYPARKKRLISAARTLSAVTKTYDGKAVLKSYRAYFREAVDFCEYIDGAWAVIYFMEPKIIKRLPEHADTIFSLGQPIEFAKMQKDLFKLSAKQMETHYDWLNIYSPEDCPFTSGDFRRMKKTVQQDEVVEQFKRYSKNRKNFSKLLLAIKNKQLRRLAEITHTYTFLKTDRIDAWKKSMRELIPFFNYLITLAPQVSFKEIVTLTGWEIEQLLKTGKMPDLHNLRLRSRHQSLYYLNKDGIIILENSAAIPKILNLLQKTGRGKTQARGTCASKGNMRGIAKIIRDSKDLSKIAKGNIFISQYTFPSFGPAMAKCSAIVTDEGGLTSHAAIVSRELKIPCVVGTKIATQIFKDGDLVEVDANKGVVKKVNS